MLHLDYDGLAAEFLRALRGKRSQRGVSKRLGYRTNIAYTWESGRSFPTASRTLWVASRVGIDVRGAITSFFGAAPPWSTSIDPATAEGVVRLLGELRGNRTIVELAAAMERSRFAVARWLTGTAEPRLPDFFRLIEVSSLRLLDFLATFVDPAKLPSVAAAWTELERTRRAAYDLPWTQAVLRALELRQYEELPRHVPGWIAKRVGISEAEERECLEALAEIGQATKQGGKWKIAPQRTLDTRRDPRAAQRTKIWWSEIALSRLRQGAEGASSYNLFAVSAADFDRLRELHRAYFQQMRAIVEQSNPSERIVIACAQMLELGETDERVGPG